LKRKLSVPLLTIVLSITVILSITSTTVNAQSAKKTSVEYIENARLLLKQVSVEYNNGNYAKADELASTAYLDNIEYVEADLNKNGHSEMVSDLEKMMVIDLRAMIKDRVPLTQIDSEISLIDAKLSEAVTVVPEFPLTVVFVVMGSMIASIVAFSRIKAARIM